MLIPALLALNVGSPIAAPPAKVIHVTIWDEQQAEQKRAYGDKFLGETIAEYLRSRGTLKGGATLEVKSVALTDPSNGLPDETLDGTDVLIWWGHQKHDQVPDALVAKIVDRVKAGKLAYLGLHSAHWSKPFMSLMNERAVEEALESLPKSDRPKAKVVRIPVEKRQLPATAPMTPSFTKEVGSDGTVTLKVIMANCAFPVVRADGKPGRITTLLPKHPIAEGIPEKFDVPQTEVYGGSFHVPMPEAKIFHERWDMGDTFDSGSVWKVGKGRVFYYRPGHEIYPVFKQAENLRIVENAVVFLSKSVKK